MAVEPVLLLRSLFLTAASIVLVVFAVPAFRSRFLAYGSRASTRPGCAAPRPNNALARLLDHVATYRVPHSWFTHFYLLSVLCSLFWAQQYAADGAVLTFVAAKAAADGAASMSLARLQAAWLLMLAQGLRRLYESLALAKPSSSRMWVTHWLLGLLFYGAMSVAVWVEGAAALKASATGPAIVQLFTDPKTLIGTLLFHWASARQHEAHAHLCSLPKYTLPTQGAFKYLVCPHYTFECVIYLSLSVLAAPEGRWLNKTVLCGLVFVAVNLGVTAVGTKEWYATKFGKDAVGGRARMVPFVW